MTENQGDKDCDSSWQPHWVSEIVSNLLCYLREENNFKNINFSSEHFKCDNEVHQKNTALTGGTYPIVHV